MSISYNIYANDGKGGNVDYNTPIATTALRTYVISQLGFPSDNTFAVRAFDTTSMIEEANTDARVRIVIDPSGNDVTAQPNAVFGLSAKATAGGACWVAWGYDTTGQGAPPSLFKVFLTAGGTSSPVSPAATVDYLPSVAGYRCTLSGLASNTSYTIEVQAVDDSGLCPGPAATVAINYQVNPLLSVDSLVAIPSAWGARVATIPVSSFLEENMPIAVGGSQFENLTVDFEWEDLAVAPIYLERHPNAAIVVQSDGLFYQ